MISADRSKQGILYPGTPAFRRHEAYAKEFGNLDIIGLSRKSDAAKFIDAGALRVYPTNSSSRFLYGLKAARVALSLSKPDVVSVQDPFETGLLGWLIARVLQRPLHVQVHTDFLSPEYAAHSFLNRLRVFVAGFVLRRAKRIRVVSPRIKRSIEARKWKFEGAISVLPIFVDKDYFRWRLPDAELEGRFKEFSARILVVSRLEPEKDVETAIRIFAEYAPVTACLIIVGDGTAQQSLQALSELLQVERRIFFEGTKDPAPYYKRADLVLSTSRYEGYGLVIAEALSAEKSVLSTDVGAARELGAIVASSREELGEKMVEWFQRGSRVGHLTAYPYKNFEAYVHSYVNDIRACASDEKTQ